MANLPRGVRLHNPGNIEHGDPWQGLAPQQSDPRFCEYITNAFGFRAIAETLCTYKDRYGLKTIRAIISRWAPPNENDTAAYIAAVAKDSGFGADEEINAHDYKEAYPLIRAITIHEQGGFEQYFSKADLDAGCVKAGLENCPRGVVGSVVKVGATVAAGAAGYAANNPQDILSGFQSTKAIVDAAPHMVQTGFWGVVIMLAVVVGVGELIRLRRNK